MQLRLEEALEEARARKSQTSIAHIEDLVLTHGFEGAKRAHHTLILLINQLTNVSIKIDGSPAILCGPHPLDKRFFIALKNSLNATDLSTAKLARSHAEIDTMYADNHPEARRKLHAAFDALHDKDIRIIHYGDILFASSNDKGTSRIGGVPHIIFKPNTIIYAIPFSSPIARRVTVADFGVYWHKTYLWWSPSSTAQGQFEPLGPPASSSFDTPDVFTLQTRGAYLPTNPTAMMKLRAGVNDIGRLSSGLQHNPFLVLLKESPKVRGFFIRYLNSLIGVGVTPSDTASLKGFLSLITGIHKSNIAMMTSPGRIAKAEVAFNQAVEAIKSTSNAMYDVLKWQSAVTKLKTELLTQLSNGNQYYGTYYKGKNGKFQQTDNEGFVVADNQGSYVKLVDRLSFTKANMDRQKLR